MHTKAESSFQFPSQSYSPIKQSPVSLLMTEYAQHFIPIPDSEAKEESSFQFPGQSYSLIEQLPVSKLMTEYAQHFIPIKVAL